MSSGSPSPVGSPPPADPHRPLSDEKIAKMKFAAMGLAAAVAVFALLLFFGVSLKWALWLVGSIVVLSIIYAFFGEIVQWMFKAITTTCVALWTILFLAGIVWYAQHGFSMSGGNPDINPIMVLSAITIVGIVGAATWQKKFGMLHGSLLLLFGVIFGFSSTPMETAFRRSRDNVATSANQRSVAQETAIRLSTVTTITIAEDYNGQVKVYKGDFGTTDTVFLADDSMGITAGSWTVCSNRPLVAYRKDRSPLNSNLRWFQINPAGDELEQQTGFIREDAFASLTNPTAAKQTFVATNLRRADTLTADRNAVEHLASVKERTSTWQHRRLSGQAALFLIKPEKIQVLYADPRLAAIAKQVYNEAVYAGYQVVSSDATQATLQTAGFEASRAPDNSVAYWMIDQEILVDPTLLFQPPGSPCGYIPAAQATPDGTNFFVGFVRTIDLAPVMQAAQWLPTTTFDSIELKDGKRHAVLGSTSVSLKIGQAAAQTTLQPPSGSSICRVSVETGFRAEICIGGQTQVYDSTADGRQKTTMPTRGEISGPTTVTARMISSHQKGVDVTGAITITFVDPSPM